jgi:hypothetical protein
MSFEMLMGTARMAFVNELSARFVFATIQMTAHLLSATRGDVLDIPMVAGQHP